jgi:eukaryotic-like serine/threonine-protein kinase
MSGRCASCEAFLNAADAARSEVRTDGSPADADTSLGGGDDLAPHDFDPASRLELPDPDAISAGMPPSGPRAPARIAAPDADLTGPGIRASGTDSDQTFLGSPPALDPDATGAGMPVPPFDPDITGPGVSRPAFDPDATRVGSSGPAASPGSARPGFTWRAATDPPIADAPEVSLPAGSRVGTPHPGATRHAGGARAYGEAATDLVGRPLGTRYQIIKLLGAGGMGAVYQAWDHELHVVVALKTVRPEITADLETARMLERRFKQELLLARQITHKNIVRVHDIGEVDGIKYITMPYLEGEDLATILKREGRLPVERVMPIARQVASGLTAAHEAGVVHRDLKPANIMILPGGDSLIMDFGVARSTGGAKPLRATGPEGQFQADRSAGQTMMGSVVGTIEYMAPEQARAESVDQRADIYAFGLIFYDLLLGRTRASRTESVVAELNLRMKEPPPSPRSIDASVPEALDRIIMRCIQSDKDARYTSISDVLADLARLDEQGRPLPIAKRVTWWMGVATLVVAASLIAGTWWLARGPAAPIEHEPVSVIIADFRNGTGDSAFERTLEPMLKLALEGAGFISAFDRSAIARGLGVPPPDDLDERAAMELAVKQGVGIVLSGSVDREGSRYVVEVKATRAVTGEVITTAANRTTSRDEVLGQATRLATSVRKALGDTTSDSAQRFAMETLSATSLEAVREYATGMDALSRANFEEALHSFSRAVEIDPKFGSAYGAKSIAARNLERRQDAKLYIEEALRHLDNMTERERYRTRGMYYLQTSDYQACVKEYGELIARFSADASARNNRALCLTSLRDLPAAVEEMRQVVRILPNRAMYRQNLALYASYSGDFEAATEEFKAMPEPGLFGLLALAFAQTGQGMLAEATETYQAMAALNEQGASYAALGLGDLAMYEGRFSDAVRLLSEGAAADVDAGNPDKAASKLVALAYAQLQRQQRAAAIAAAEKALANSQEAKIRFLAARVFVEAGASARARALSESLAAEFQAEPRAYAKIIDALTALQGGNPRQAITLLTDANGLLDTWIGHFDLGRAYLEAGALPQADSEFDRCLKRRGEALSLFLDEMPTSAYFPPVYYYQGRVREGLNSARFAESYGTYLDIRANSKEDPLLPDARRRAGR